MTPEQIKTLERREADPDTAKYGWVWADGCPKPFKPTEAMNDYDVVANQAALLRVQALEDMKGRDWDVDVGLGHGWVCQSLGARICFHESTGQLVLMNKDMSQVITLSIVAAQLAAEPNQQEAVAMMRDVRG